MSLEGNPISYCEDYRLLVIQKLSPVKRNEKVRYCDLFCYKQETFVVRLLAEETSQIFFFRKHFIDNVRFAMKVKIKVSVLNLDETSNQL